MIKEFKVGPVTMLCVMVWAVLLTGCQPQEGITDETAYGFDPAYEPLIDSVLQLLSLEEKIHMIHANGLFTSGGVERLGLPDLRYTDGPN